MKVGKDLEKFDEESILSKIRDSWQYQEENFIDIWYSHLNRASRVVTAAKIYILDNYEKITDYTDLHLILRHNRGKHYFGPKRNEKTPSQDEVKKTKKKSDSLEKLMQRIDEKKIQIDSFEEAVYDWTDGDFSVTFNGLSYLWIDDESVISIASYIENKINNGYNDKL
jgi:hypothetical protein